MRAKNTPAPGPTNVPHKERTLDVAKIPAAAGGPDSSVKRDGIKVRGTGAATKGLMARGPV